MPLDNTEALGALLKSEEAFTSHMDGDEETNNNRLSIQTIITNDLPEPQLITKIQSDPFESDEFILDGLQAPMLTESASHIFETSRSTQFEEEARFKATQILENEQEVSRKGVRRNALVVQDDNQAPHLTVAQSTVVGNLDNTIETPIRNESSQPDEVTKDSVSRSSAQNASPENVNNCFEKHDCYDIDCYRHLQYLPMTETYLVSQQSRSSRHSANVIESTSAGSVEHTAYSDCVGNPDASDTSIVPEHDVQASSGDTTYDRSNMAASFMAWKPAHGSHVPKLQEAPHKRGIVNSITSHVDGLQLWSRTDVAAVLSTGHYQRAYVLIEIAEISQVSKH